MQKNLRRTDLYNGRSYLLGWKSHAAPVVPAVLRQRTLRHNRTSHLMQLLDSASLTLPVGSLSNSIWMLPMLLPLSCF